MNLTAIKKVVMAAILLPFLVMIAGSVMIVRMSYVEYSALDADKRYANILSEAGSLASSVIPNEARMTIAYLAHPDADSRDAMGVARISLDQAKQDLYFALSDEPVHALQLTRLLKDWHVTYGKIVDFRHLVDAGTAKIEGIVPAYQPSSLKQLEVVDFLATRITDRVLLHKSSEFFSILMTHEGGIVTNFLVRRSLAENGLGVADRDKLAEAQASHRAGISQLRYHADTPIISEILAFEQSETGKRIERFGQAVLANIQPATPDVIKEWDLLQHERFNFWRAKIAEEILDIRRSGDDLAARSRMHLTFMVILATGLFILVAVVAVLAARGINLVDKLTREREVLVTELRSAAQTDLLTGLFNRRGFETAASALLEQAARGSRWVSIVLFDLDHFKQVNDVYGHDAGDAVLREVALIARKHFRSFDLLVRHGGEEFLALLPDSTPEEAAAVAERVRQAIEATEIMLAGGATLTVTASFGCAGREDKAGSRVLDVLIKRADLALYAAKHSGRNRVVADAFVPDSHDNRRPAKSS